MGVDTTTAIEITCDNPDCPNKKNLPEGLEADNMAGWLHITSEVYGEQAETHVFCSFKCAAALADARAAG
jgi:hypothetical protein